MNCKSCGQSVHPKRIDLGYHTCVSCSTEERWSGVPVINHKTGNEIQIVKDPEVAAEFMAKTARVGFGTMRGMTTGYKKRVSTTAPKIEPLPDKPLVDRVIARTAMPHEYETVGEEMMNVLENHGRDAAALHIDKALEEKRIYRKHHEQLNSILAVIASAHE
jgi:hypothetical protein